MRLVSTSFKLASGWNILISREQVEVLPNFAMTDYASQGKTRPINIVDLNNCSGHQSYYTCMSSASAADTIILQGFDSKQITGGASGWLRQEFRELEILDEITQLKYESLLPKQVDGHWRNTLLINFREWKGLNYVPPQTHPAIQWNEKNPLDISVSEYISWKLVKQPGKEKDSRSTDDNKIKQQTHMGYFIPAKGSIPMPVNDNSSVTHKHKERDDGDNLPEKKKKQKIHANNNNNINSYKCKEREDSDELPETKKKQKLQLNDNIYSKKRKEREYSDDLSQKKNKKYTCLYFW